MSNKMSWVKIAHHRFEELSFDIGLVSHMSNPVASNVSGGVFKIFFSSRDEMQRSRICSVNYDIDKLEIKKGTEKIILDLGPKGAFDDSGLSMGCLLQQDNKVYLYYLGWNLAVNVPFRNSIGLAEAGSIEGPFTKISMGPIIDRNINDPLSVSYPYVIYHNGVYKMWYGSHKSWGKTADDMVHVMKYAESSDGIVWNRSGQICLDECSGIYAYSRPMVLIDDQKYKMWYSYRGDKYQIGYAESVDGLKWERKDSEAGIDVSGSGWDSEMIEYPFVFHHQGDQYILYNGNSYGKTGFGIAKANVQGGL